MSDTAGKKEVSYIEQDALSQILVANSEVKDEKKRKKVTIIDVRDRDYYGGNIPGCVHAPSSQFVSLLPYLAKDHKDDDLIVFHCMYSQQRGPYCSNLFVRTLNKEYPNAKCEVSVLRSGFGGWVQRFKGDKNQKIFLDNVDASVWR